MKGGICRLSFSRYLILLSQIKKAVEERIPTVDVSDDGLGPWSNSTVKSLEKCPLKFFMDRCLKIKTPEVLTEDSYVTYVGRASHVWLESISLGDSIQDGLDKAKEKHYHEVTDKYWHKVEELRGSVMSFKARMDEFKARHGDLTVYPEMKLGITKDLRKTGFFSKDVYFRGIIDLPILLPNKDLVVLDHKTGGSGDYGIKHHVRQLNTQALLFHHAVTPIRGAQVGIHFISEGSIKLDPYQPANELLEITARELFMDIKDAVRKVKDAGRFYYSRGTHCKYCNYREMCQNGKRGTSGELAFVEEASKSIFK